MNQKKSETYGFMRKGKKGCLSYWVVPYKIAWHSERETIAAFAGITLANLPEKCFSSKKDAIAYIEENGCNPLTSAKVLALAKKGGWNSKTAKADYDTLHNFQRFFIETKYIEIYIKEEVRKEKISKSLKEYYQIQKEKSRNHDQLTLF